MIPAGVSDDSDDVSHNDARLLSTVARRLWEK